MSEALPKGQMVQPTVYAGVRPDQPNSPRHDALRAEWQPGQRWETLVEGCTQWVPVAEPTWDHHQEYRRVA